MPVLLATRKYRPKPVVVDAVQWDGNPDTADRFFDERQTNCWFFCKGTPDLTIDTDNGWATCRVGNWIVKDAEGLIRRVLSAADFEATYESVKGPDG